MGLPRVLIIEDDQSIRETLEMVLRLRGYDVSLAENGKEGLEALKRGPQLPIAVIFDLMMPIMDGWEFSETVGNDPGLGAVPMIVMTAFGESSRAMPRADHVLRKPLRLSELLDVLQQYRDGDPARAA